MRAAILERPGQPLRVAELAEPQPVPGQLKLKVDACAVCRTDLHLRDQEIPATKLPVVLGHQIVGRTDDGRRVGVPWLGWTDGTCEYCASARENLCPNARFTGRDIDGGYAEWTVAVTVASGADYFFGVRRAPARPSSPPTAQGS